MENMNKTEKLKSAYATLKNGYKIRFIPDNIADHHNKGVECWLQAGRNNSRIHYIYWRDFGQSANRMNIENLRWIAKTIGECTTYNYEILR